MDNNTRLLFIGDPHFQIDNLLDIDGFINKILNLIEQHRFDFVVVAGDLLHTHERLHTTVFNKACDFIEKLSNVILTYVLVGNHDFTSNSEFLTTNHWMNPLKKWDNVIIVDKVLNHNINGCNFTFVPYVYPGRFIEALNTLDGEIWKKSECIFAHQEFKGCKMGSIISSIGDEWSVNNPFVISGHIHTKQYPQSNIYYTGTPMQHSFGETDKKTVSIVTFDDNKKMNIDDICLDMPSKKIKYVNINELSSFEYNKTNDNKLRLTVKGSYDEFKAVKKTSKYKKLIADGVKIMFKHMSENTIEDISINSEENTTCFLDVLHRVVLDKKDTYLLCEYDKIMHNKTTNPENFFFL